MPFLYDVLNVKPQLYARGLVWSRGGGGKHFSKTFSISYILNSKNSVSDPYFNRYLSNAKNTCGYNTVCTKRNANYVYSLITRAPLKIIIFNLHDT